MAETWAILGGYGNTGTRIAELLLVHTDLRLVLAGRDAGRAAARAAELNRRFGAERVRAACADAADPASLKRLLSGIALLVVAASSTEHVRTVAGAALDARTDYLDTQLGSPEKIRALRALGPEIERRGLCFVTDGGFHPGLPALLVRYAATRVQALEDAHVGSVIAIDWRPLAFSRSTLREMLVELGSFQTLVLKDGQWASVGWRPRHFDFGPPFGRRPAYPMFLEELRALPELVPTLQGAGFYVGGFDPLTDWLVMPMGMVAARVAPRALAGPFGRLLDWSLRRGSRPPFGTLLRLEARGVSDGAPTSIRLSVAHEDGYLVTAAAAVSCLRQLLDRTARRPGVWFQAHLPDPAGVLADLARFGLSVSEERAVAAA